MSSLLFFVNSVKVTLEDVQPEVTLLEFLRERGLTGTKLGCGEVGREPHGTLRVVAHRVSDTLAAVLAPFRPWRI